MQARALVSRAEDLSLTRLGLTSWLANLYNICFGWCCSWLYGVIKMAHWALAQCLVFSSMVSMSYPFTLPQDEGNSAQHLTGAMVSQSENAVYTIFHKYFYSRQAVPSRRMRVNSARVCVCSRWCDARLLGILTHQLAPDDLVHLSYHICSTYSIQRFHQKAELQNIFF